LGRPLPFAASESNASVPDRTNQPNAAKSKAIERAVFPKVYGHEFRIAQNSEVTEIHGEEHGRR